MMRRRDLILTLGAAVALPRGGFGQSPAPLKRVAVLFPQNSPAAKSFVAPFAEELRKLGWVEGTNIGIDYRFAAGDETLFVRYAQEIVSSAPDVIVAVSPPAVLALREQTRTIPIVFESVGDPVGYGFIDSMARPGGNITGIANFGFAMGGKWVEILKEIAPNLSRAAFIYHPATTTKGYDAYLRSVMAAAPTFGVAVSDTPLRDEADIEKAITDFAREPNGGLIVPPDPFTIEHQRPIFALAERYRLPAVYTFSFFVASGGLVSYGVDGTEQIQRTAVYVSRILKGEKPADLPAEDPTKFELFVNEKSAKAIGLAIPPTLLARADEVIE